MLGSCNLFLPDPFAETYQWHRMSCHDKHATICCIYYGRDCKPCYISSPHICVSLDLRDIFQVHYSFLEIHLHQIFVLYLQKIRINSSRHPDIHKRTEKSPLSLTARWDLHVLAIAAFFQQPLYQIYSSLTLVHLILQSTITIYPGALFKTCHKAVLAIPNLAFRQPLPVDKLCHKVCRRIFQYLRRRVILFNITFVHD